MDVAYYLASQGKTLQPGTGGRHRINADRAVPAMHERDEGIEIGLLALLRAPVRLLRRGLA